MTADDEIADEVAAAINGGRRVALARISCRVLEKLLRLPAGTRIVGVAPVGIVDAIDHSIMVGIESPTLPICPLGEEYPRVDVVMSDDEPFATIDLTGYRR